MSGCFYAQYRMWRLNLLDGNNRRGFTLRTFPQRVPFSGPDRAVGQVCVSVRTTTFEMSDFWFAMLIHLVALWVMYRVQSLPVGCSGLIEK